MTIAEVLDRVAGRGEFGVWLGGLDGRPAISRDADHSHYAASTMKLAVAVALMRMVDAGSVGLDRPVDVHDDFASARPGARFGVRREEDDAPATWDHLGGQVSLGWLTEQMISRSSNLATDLVLELTGIQAADAVLREFGSGRSAIRRGIDDEPAASAGISNEMTAADLAAILTAVANDKAASPASSAYLRDLLAANEWNGEIPAGVPTGTPVEHKNGWDTGIRHDAGIVRPPDAEPFVLAVLTSSDLPDAEAQRLIADIAAVAWRNRHDLAAVR